MSRESFIWVPLISLADVTTYTQKHFAMFNLQRRKVWVISEIYNYDNYYGDWI